LGQALNNAGLHTQWLGCPGYCLVQLMPLHPKTPSSLASFKS